MPFSQEIKLEAILKGFRFGESRIAYGARIGEVKLQKWRDGWRNLTFLFRKRLGLLYPPSRTIPMCGFAAFHSIDGLSPEPAWLAAAAAALRHRGPDDQGFFAEPGVGLAFRRLSIVDVATGHQPLANEDGTVWIAFNGEIYNHA